MCSTDSVEKNLEISEVFIQQAASNKAKLIVLPEMFAMMGASSIDKVAVKEK